MRVKLFSLFEYGIVEKGGIWYHNDIKDFETAVKRAILAKALGVAVTETKFYSDGTKMKRPRKKLLIGEWIIVNKKEAVLLNKDLDLKYINMEKYRCSYYYNEVKGALVCKDKSTNLLPEKFISKYRILEI